jgi:hypothetical protein
MVTRAAAEASLNVRKSGLHGWMPGLPSARFRLGRQLKAFRDGLVGLFNGGPGPAQQHMIDRAVRLCHVLSRLEQGLLIETDLGTTDRREYLAWSRELSTTVKQIEAAARLHNKMADAGADPYEQIGRIIAEQKAMPDAG